jgi:B9 domain-containing protein 2
MRTRGDFASNGSLLPNSTGFQVQMGDPLQKSAADYKPEIHIFGQLIGAQDFETSDGLFCEIVFQIGDTWELLSLPRCYQTQTAYKEDDDYFVWCHPIDIHLSVGDLGEWPRAMVKVWRLDENNKIDMLSYGMVNMPRTAGFHRLEVSTWIPMKDHKSAALSFFMGNQPKLVDSWTLLTNNDNARTYLTTSSSGKVIFELDVILKNFKELHISGH